MSLNYRQQRQIRRMEVGLRRSDPHLGAMFGMFGRLYPAEDMPAWEQEPRVPSSQARLQRAAARIVVALTPAARLERARSRGEADTPATRRGDSPGPGVPALPAGGRGTDGRRGFRRTQVRL